MPTFTTQDLVDSLTSIYCEQGVDLRQQHFFEQTLHSLVRLAKSEQLLEIKTSVKKLTHSIPTESGMGLPQAYPRG